MLKLLFTICGMSQESVRENGLPVSILWMAMMLCVMILAMTLTCLGAYSFGRMAAVQATMQLKE
jgi:hypothetical protein